MKTDNWEYIKYCGMRMSGFPFELIERLKFSRTVEKMETLIELETKILAASDAITESIDKRKNGISKKELNLNNILKSINKRKRISQKVIEKAGMTEGINDLNGAFQLWNRDIEAYQECYSLTRGIFEEELTEKRRELYRLAKDEKIREAVFLFAPEFYHRLEQYNKEDFKKKWSSKIKRIELKLALYLQRLCGKNENTSYFGALGFGEFDNRNSANLKFQVDEFQPLARRDVFFSHWSIDKIAFIISMEPEIRKQIVCRLGPACHIKWKRALVAGHAGIFEMTVQTHKLSSFQYSIVKMGTKRFTIEEILNEFPDQKADITDAAIRKLAQKGILIDTIKIPSGTKDPLTDLIKALRTFKQNVRVEYWINRVTRLKELSDKFAGADLTRRVGIFEEIEKEYNDITGLEPRRRGGNFYSDRFVIFESCVRNIKELEIGGRIIADLEDKLSWLHEVYYLSKVLNAEYVNKIIKGWIRKILKWRYQKSMPFIPALKKYKEKGFDSPLKDDSIQNIYNFLIAELKTNGEKGLSGKCSIGSETREKIINHLRRVTDKCKKGASFLSPDFFIAGNSIEEINKGNYKIVIGEHHPGIGITGLVELGDEIINLIADESIRKIRKNFHGEIEGKALAHTCGLHPNKTFMYERFPGVCDVCVTGESTLPPRQQMDLNDIRITSKGREVFLYSKKIKKNLRFIFGEISALLLPFLLNKVVLFRLQDVSQKHSPRIELDNIILERERWNFPRSAWDKLFDLDDFDLFFQLNHGLRKFNIPKYVFVKTDKERKPIMVDFDNLFLILNLKKMIAGSESYTITEMIPAPDQLWFRDRAGRYTCEFRCTAFRKADD